MKRSTLQLEHFYFNKLNIEFCLPQKTSKEAPKEHKLAIHYDVAVNNNNNNLFRLLFKTTVTPVSKKAGGLKIDTEMFGFFSFPENTPSEDMEYLIRVNGCSILYGILKGQLPLYTASFPEEFYLPTIIMEDVVEHVENNRNKATKNKNSAKSYSV
jgi:preprotein translocase subunit SecB